MCCMLVRHGSSYVGVVEVLSFDARPFPRKETCLLEGQVPYNALLARALTLGVSRGVLIWHPDLFPVPYHVLAYLAGKATKRTTVRLPVPYHASRDWRVRWEHARRIKCPGSRERVRRRAASLRLRSPDSYEPASVFDGSRHSSPGWFVGCSFRVRGYGHRGPCVRLGRASSWRPRLAYGCSRYARQLRYPLLISLTVVPEPPFERLRSSGGYILWSGFRGDARATPRG